MILDPETRAYTEIANAIVLRAVDDYRNALKGIGIAEKTPEYVIGECEHFFRSRWYRILTKVDGEYLISFLRKEHLEYERSRNESKSNTGNA